MTSPVDLSPEMLLADALEYAYANDPEITALDPGTVVFAGVDGGAPRVALFTRAAFLDVCRAGKLEHTIAFLESNPGPVAIAQGADSASFAAARRVVGAWTAVADA